MTNGNREQLIRDVSECVELLDDTIVMHDIHIKDPKTATPESQKEMMELMLDTRDCILRRLRVSGKDKWLVINMDDKITHNKIEKSLKIICPLYKENLITDAYIIGSVAKGTAREESDIDILIINPLFEAYLEELNPDGELENIKNVVDKLKDMGVQFKLVERRKDGATKFWYEIYNDELFHIMPQRVFMNNLPSVQITKDICD